jgi:uncharacterized protein
MSKIVLQELFQALIIPKAVDLELRALHIPGSYFSELAWVEVVSVQNTELVLSLKKDLDQGEAETIALSKQLHADIVLIDENAGYQIAKLFELPVVRTLSLLKTAKEKKIISAVKPLIEEMVQKGRWYSKAILDKFLRDIGE